MRIPNRDLAYIAVLVARDCRDNPSRQGDVVLAEIQAAASRRGLSSVHAAIKRELGQALTPAEVVQSDGPVSGAV